MGHDYVMGAEWGHCPYEGDPRELPHPPTMWGHGERTLGVHWSAEAAATAGQLVTRIPGWGGSQRAAGGTAAVEQGGRRADWVTLASVVARRRRRRGDMGMWTVEPAMVSLRKDSCWVLQEQRGASNPGAE